MKPEKFDEREDFSSNTLNIFKKCCRDRVKTLRVGNNSNSSDHCNHIVVQAT
jgi:hypothetical protein